MARWTPIRLALMEQNRSQKWLAAELGKSDTVVSRIVNGLACDDETTAAICRLLNRPEGVLFPHLVAASDHTAPDSGSVIGKAAA